MIDWDSMNDLDLKVCLKSQLAQEVPDCEMVNGILAELEKRDPVKTIPIEAVVEWDRIKAREKQKKHRRVHWWRTAIAAALAVVLLGVVPSALGAENIFEAIGRWTKDIFTFGEKESTEFVFQTDHPGLQELYDIVSQLGVTQKVVPTWLPDGFETKSIEQKNSPKGITAFAIFTDGARDIEIFVFVGEGNKEIDYQKDDERVEVFEFDGRRTYFISNNGEYCAMWQIDNIECSIYADAKEDVYAIIDSIYRSEK